MDICSETDSGNISETKRILKPWKLKIHNFIHGPLPRMKGYRQSPDECKQFSPLDKLLSLKCGQAAFHVFLKSEFCEENLEFWLACEEFKSVSSPDELACRAASIYEEFVRIDSPKEINVDSYTRDHIAHNLQFPSSSCFVRAQSRVYSLMENDVYPRFIQSDCYRDLCKAASGGQSLGKFRRV